jgi:hypothetical protein
MEGIDLCWRMQNAGFTVCYFPHSVVGLLGGEHLVTDHFKNILQLPQQLIMLGKNSLRDIFADLIISRFSTAGQQYAFFTRAMQPRLWSGTP